jgi:hypothetical protein
VDLPVGRQGDDSHKQLQADEKFAYLIILLYSCNTTERNLGNGGLSHLNFSATCYLLLGDQIGEL